jgi:hypothetical protein
MRVRTQGAEESWILRRPVSKKQKGCTMHKPHQQRASCLVLLLLALGAGLLAASFPQPAAAHDRGSWMFPADAQRAVEARGYTLAICSGRGRYKTPGIVIPDRRYLLFRHFECFVTEGKVLCIHTLPRRRIAIRTQPLGSRCRF